MEDERTLVLQFTDTPADQANKYALELRDMLMDASKDISAELRPSEELTQDFGSTIVLILGAPAVIIAARRLGDYLKLRQSVRLRIKGSNGEILADNISGKDAISIVKLFTQSK